MNNSAMPKLCIACGKELSDGAKRYCRKCYHESRRKSPNHCIDCGKVITGNAERCRPCAMKARGRDQTWRRKIAQAAQVRGNDPDWRREHSKAIKAAWRRGAYDSRGTEWRQKKSEEREMAWKNGCYDGIFDSDRMREIRAEVTANCWANGVYDGAEIRQRWSDGMMGENNPQWRGGISFEPYDPGFNTEKKLAVRARDRFTCMFCGKPEIDQAHCVHHIDYDKKNSEMDNLITLCSNCHPKTNTNREYWTTVLSEIVQTRGSDEKVLELDSAE